MKKAKASEPIEVTNFRNKIKEIAKSQQDYSDAEKSKQLYEVAKDLIDVYGMPSNTDVPKEITTNEEKVAYLGFVKFTELIKNR